MRISDWSSDVCSSDLSGEEIAGQPLDVLLSSHVVASHRHHMSDSETALRVNERVEIVGRRKNGEEFPAEAAIVQIIEDGNATFMAVIDRKSVVQGKSV